MRNTIKENIRNYISGHCTQVFQSYVILIANMAVFLFVAVAVSKSRSFTPEQLKYAIPNEKTGYTDSGPQGVFSYGPYNDLGKGSYRATIYYVTDTDTTFDVCYKDDNGILSVIKEGVLDSDKDHKSFVFNNKQDIDNDSFEVRTYYQGTGYLQIKGISLGHFFHFDKYMIVTTAAIILSLLFVCGNRLKGFLERPREVLCFGTFYNAVACLCLYAMAYCIGQEKMWLHGILNVLVVLHAYGGRKGIYDNEVVAGNVVSAACYGFLFYSLYRLDQIMRGIVSEPFQTVYADNTPYIFTCCIIACILMVAAWIKKVWVKRVFYGIVYYAFVILLMVQDIYYQVFSRLFSFKDIQLAGEGSDYAGYVLSLLDDRFWITFIPLIITGAVGVFLFKYTLTISKEGKIASCSVLASVILYINMVYTKSYEGWDVFNDENYIYNTMHDRVRAYKLCGFYQYGLKDFTQTFMRSFGADKEQIAKISTFFEGRGEEGARGTNFMTGILEGKNVIFVLMESIDDIACREDVMPTLYRMSEEGISFSNMYASIYGSAATINSETATNIGYYAPQDGSVIYSFADNYFPDSLAARFENAGYVARQYHFNYPQYYDRESMSRAFGYKEYVSFIENMNGTGADPGLDTILVEDDKLYQALVQDEKFFDYIISFTTHLPYDKTDAYVQTALERHPEYEGLTYSEEINNYFAKARITDDMLSGLIQRLEQDGLMDNTVIVAMGDHYPYGLLDKEALYDLSAVDEYEQLLYKVPCVIWTPGMEAVKVDKTASSIDVVPTIVNMMGMGDTAVYIGNDIFDENYAGYAYFSDGSWICGDTYYYQGKLVSGMMDENEIADINRKVMEAINANDNILHTDYWRHHK